MDFPSSELKDLIRLRHHLHEIAEPSGQETRTAAAMAEFFSTCQPAQILTGLGGTGVAAVYEGVSPGATIVLRAELDALPIPETMDLPWASVSPGISHKCGHDGHLTILAGVARNLGRKRPPVGRVVLLCQPAEETGHGARAVAADTRFRDLDPQRFFALHNLPGYPKGQVVVREGPFAAGSAGLTARLIGRTSHAAQPELGNSPDKAMANLVTALVALPIHLDTEDQMALVTIGHARLGEPAFGITPGDATIMATLRSDDDGVLNELKLRAEELVGKTAEHYHLQSQCLWSEEFPVTCNDAESVHLVGSAAEALGLSCTMALESPFRWSEDFGYLLALGQGAMFGLGVGSAHPALHAEDYDFPDDLLPMAVNLLTHLALL